MIRFTVATIRPTITTLPYSCLYLMLSNGSKQRSQSQLTISVNSTWRRQDLVHKGTKLEGRTQIL